DFLLPQRFDLTYVGEAGNADHRPVVIHRGIVSTMERVVAYLLERYKGASPTWLPPVQAVVIPVTEEAHGDAVMQLVNDMKRKGLRGEADLRNEKMGYKIREAQTFRIPYQIVIGENEIKDDVLSVRKYGEKKTESID